MDVAITRMSSKGQIVIPVEMREGIKEGEKMILIKHQDQIIVEKINHLNKKLEEDLEFAKRTSKAWKRYDKGEFEEMEFDDFIEKLKKW